MKYRVPLVDLARLHRTQRSELLGAIARVLDSGEYILGSEVDRFEREAAELLGVTHAVGVSSGTDALSCALLAAGVGPGDVVLTTALSFVATATAILRVGALPRFCDVDAVTYNLDLDALPDDELAGVAAIVVVHLFGHPADVSAIRRRVGPSLPIIEDAAQAFGARAAAGPVGALGDLASFSFFPAKPLGALGDGGMVTTTAAALAARCRRLRVHGRDEAGRCLEAGSNMRLDALQAAVLRTQLPQVTARRAARTQHAALYARLLIDLEEITLPGGGGAPGVEPSWSVYSVRVAEHRDELRRHLASHGIETAVYYPRPLPDEPLFAGLLGARRRFPIAERLCRELLALPVAAELGEAGPLAVSEAIRAFYSGKR